MVTFPNAKINIGLNITAKIEDGFHAIETIFFPIGLMDILEYIPSNNKNNLSISGIELESNTNDNLVMRAYQELSKEYPLPALQMHIHKKIPFGAGLGGGSANAAFMLKSLNESFQLNIEHEKLERIAGKLGSDCPFFLKNRPVYAYDRGDKMDEMNIDLKGYHLLLVVPNISISTPWAYSNCKPARPSADLRKLIKQPISSWQNNIKNDFEPIVFKNYPEIALIKSKLLEMGALFASLSGSGAAVYGIFKKEPDYKNRFPNAFTWEETF